MAESIMHNIGACPSQEMSHPGQQTQSKKQILGIVLVKNEDRFVEQVVRNVWDFCDRLLLVDNKSQDGTVGILRNLAISSTGKASFHEISHPKESHDLLRPYAGTNTWVFGVDGDEIYDPQGLRAFRKRLLSGEFDRHWMILGNVLHCDRLDIPGCQAFGFKTPPNRSITKLYNFAAIDSWEGYAPERLHGGTPKFFPGFSGEGKRQLQSETTWEESHLRCLHVCFLSRSSIDRNGSPRVNFMEKMYGGWAVRIKRLSRRLACVPEVSDWKRKHYTRGKPVNVSTEPFFSLSIERTSAISQI